jgi:hypothetical protein
MMYFEAARKYNCENWNYIEIPDEMLLDRYDWVDVKLPNDKERNHWSKERYPWAHERNMQRLFLLCITFPSKKEATEWINSHLQVVITPIHISLMELFCYPASNTTEALDQLINQSEDNNLLIFIQKVLDRSLLWFDPFPSYRSDFQDILWYTNESIKIGIKHSLEWVSNPKLDGVHFDSSPGYTHVFYKYQNLLEGIAKGELYYDIQDLARQAHLTLLKSMSIFFEHSYKLTFYNEENWERKFNEIAGKETEWCKLQFRNFK